MKKLFLLPLLLLITTLGYAQPNPTKNAGGFATILGTDTMAPSSIFEARSTTKGVLFPRMTTTQRNAISSPATSLIIFNTTTGKYEYYLGGDWVELGGSTTPDATTTVKGIVKLAGDLGGTADAPTVPALANKANTADLGATAFSNDYNDLDNLPAVGAVTSVNTQTGDVVIGLQDVTDGSGNNETTNPLIIKDPSDPDNKYIEIKGDVINIYDLSLSILPIGIYSKDGFIIADSGTTTRGLFDVISGYTVEDGAKAFSYGLDFQAILDKITNRAIYFQYPGTIDNNYTVTWRNRGGNPAFVDEIPTSLSELSEDVSHRTVTDAEKSAWNAVIGGSVFQSVWNANTNSPALSSGVGTKGYYYIVNTNGSTNLDGITDWKVGDWAIFDGSVWRKVDNTDAVSSVNGLTGAVNLDTSNVPDTSGKRYVSETEKSTWSGKQDSLSDSNFGSFSNSLTSKTTPVDADSINIVDSADSNKSKKLSLTNFKTFLANTFSLKSMGANTIRVNKTNATANATEQPYKADGMLTLDVSGATFGGTAPFGAVDATYNYTEFDNMVYVSFNIVYASQGTSVTSITIPFPTALPAPKIPTGLNSADAILYMGTGRIINSVSTSSAASTLESYVKRNSTNTGNEIFIRQAAVNAKYFLGSFFYPKN